MPDGQTDISLAVGRLRDSLATAPEPAVLGRVEVPFPPLDPLLWLSGQTAAKRGYWADRLGHEAVAAAGEADELVADSLDYAAMFAAIGDRLRGAPESTRYYGGFRFGPPAAPDPAWTPFGAARFLLPRIELIRRDTAHTLACNWRRGESRADVNAELERLAPPAPPAPPPVPRLLKRTDLPDAGQWRSAVQTVLDRIRDGSLRKAVLSRLALLQFDQPLDPMPILRRLAPASAGVFRFCGSYGGQLAFIGASPECLYRRGGRSLVSEAVAGTRPRGTTPEEDERLGRELEDSRKEQVEHEIVVRGIVDALSPLCRNVTAAARPGRVKLNRVQHLSTAVRGELRDGVGDAEILSAIHPTPAVGGTPREAALRLIRDLEPFDRGWYTGPVGWVGRDAAEFIVALRCGVVAGNRLGLFSGAGIVEDSNPDDEWNEVDMKIRHFLGILGLAE